MSCGSNQVGEGEKRLEGWAGLEPGGHLIPEPVGMNAGPTEGSRERQKSPLSSNLAATALQADGEIPVTGSHTPSLVFCGKRRTG